MRSVQPRRVALVLAGRLSQLPARHSCVEPRIVPHIHEDPVLTTHTAVGDTVTWVWMDNNQHDVVSGAKRASDGRFRSGSPVIDRFKQYKVDFTGTLGTPGEYPFFCSVHGDMNGVITVVAPTTTTPAPTTTTTTLPAKSHLIQWSTGSPQSSFSITVNAGEEVVWLFVDSDKHSVTVRLVAVGRLRRVILGEIFQVRYVLSGHCSPRTRRVESQAAPMESLTAESHRVSCSAPLPSSSRGHSHLLGCIRTTTEQTQALFLAP